MKKDYVSLKSSLLLDCKKMLIFILFPVQFYGARPIRRWMEKRVVTELSKMLIREEIDENSTVQIDDGPNGSGLVYKVEKNGGLVNAATGQK